jgi:ABC-type nitrate/sulfonate/bicarbonate transport system substrate-binding protein
MLGTNIMRANVMTKFMRIMLVFVGANLLLAIVCVQLQAASAPRRFVIGHAAMNARVAPLWVGEDLGFFAKQGVSVNAIFIRQAPVLVAALTAGDVHAAYTGGTTVLAGTVWLGAMLGLEHLGLEAKRDNITFLVIGDQTVATQALEGGQIDATVLDGVFSRRLKQKGFTILAELQKANIPFSSQGLVARGAFLQEQRETMESVMKGMLESIAFCLAPRNKSAVLATITRRLKLADASVAEDGYQDVINGVERKPYPVVEGLRNIQRLMKIRNPALDKVKVEDMIDDRILRRLDESGFIDQLAKTYPAK